LTNYIFCDNKYIITKIIFEIEFKNITEENIIEFTEFFVTILNNAGEEYMSDFEDCVDY